MKILSYHTTMTEKCKRKLAIGDVFAKTFPPLLFSANNFYGMFYLVLQ